MSHTGENVQGRLNSKTSAFRAQAAVELMSYAAFFLLILVATIAIFFQTQSQETTRAENAYAQEIAYGFADHIRTAFIAGSGFSENFTIQPSILGKPYRILVSGYGASPASVETGIVYVEWQGPGGNASFSAPTVTAAYGVTTYGQFITHPPGNFIVIDSEYGQSLLMNNTNGVIRISKG